MQQTTSLPIYLVLIAGKIEFYSPRGEEALSAKIALEIAGYQPEEVMTKHLPVASIARFDETFRAKQTQEIGKILRLANVANSIAAIAQSEATSYPGDDDTAAGMLRSLDNTPVFSAEHFTKKFVALSCAL